MILLLSLALAAVFVGAGSKWLKAHARQAYLLATALALGTVALVWSGTERMAPDWLRQSVLPLLTHGGLASALFMVVMFTGTLKNGSRGMKKLMPVRGELSMVASILTLGHNVAYGRTYFVALFTAAELPWNTRMAAVCSLLMLIIMLPLFITSFPDVRRKMRAKNWKKLQRFAYGFYGLMGVHVMLLYLPSARLGSVSACVNVWLYGLIFLSYAVLRIRKALWKRKAEAPLRRVPIVVALVAYALLLSLTIPPLWPASASTQADAQVEAQASDGDDAAAEEQASGAQLAGEYADGTYSGTGKGYNGKLTVELTIEQNAVASLTVTSAADDEPYITKATRGITKQLLERQSAELDGVSGATYSSKGLIQAIEQALESAEQ